MTAISMLELSKYSLLVIPSTAGFLDFVHGHVFQVGHILEITPSWYTI